MSERDELREIVSSLKDVVKAKGRDAGALKARARRPPAAKPAVPPAAPSLPAEAPTPSAAVPPAARSTAFSVPTPPASPAPSIVAGRPTFLSSPPAEVGENFIDDPAISPPEKLRRLREEIGDCHRCPLGDNRIKLAFGVGNPRARVMFVGEGPGYQEDRQGEPFVGPAGQLLDKILEATGLSRKPVEPEHNWVYIGNMVKCHPMIDPSDNTKRGNDRPPTPEEMAVCSPFLMKQIRIIRPLFIVALGATAGKGMLKTEEGISKFRGKWFDWFPEGDMGLKIRFLPTYHPAALLRNPGLKKDVWEDMKALRAALDKAVG